MIQLLYHCGMANLSQLSGNAHIIIFPTISCLFWDVRRKSTYDAKAIIDQDHAAPRLALSESKMATQHSNSMIGSFQIRIERHRQTEQHLKQLKVMKEVQLRTPTL